MFRVYGFIFFLGAMGEEGFELGVSVFFLVSGSFVIYTCRLARVKFVVRGRRESSEFEE